MKVVYVIVCTELVFFQNAYMTQTSTSLVVLLEFKQGIGLPWSCIYFYRKLLTRNYVESTMHFTGNGKKWSLRPN